MHASGRRSEAGSTGLTPGQQVADGRYLVLRELNCGATARVYEAQDQKPGTRDHHRVALKVLQGLGEPCSAPYVSREIQSGRHLHHPSLAKLLDVAVHGDSLILVWELVDGPDALDLVTEAGPLSEPAAAQVVSQLLDALQYMHSQSFCHRDLKLENLLIDQGTLQLKVVDFGLTRQNTSAPVTLGAGTLDFIAPELVEGSYNRACNLYPVDVWGVGIVLYCLVTARMPFQSRTRPNSMPATLRNIMQGRLQPPPPSVSPGCEALIRSLLTVDPSARPSLEAVRQHPWLREHCSSPGPTCSQPLEPFVAAWRATRAAESCPESAGLAVAAVSDALSRASLQQARRPGREGISRNLPWPEHAAGCGTSSAAPTSKRVAAVNFTADCRADRRMA